MGTLFSVAIIPAVFEVCMQFMLAADIKALPSTAAIMILDVEQTNLCILFIFIYDTITIVCASAVQWLRT